MARSTGSSPTDAVTSPPESRPLLRGSGLAAPAGHREAAGSGDPRRRVVRERPDLEARGGIGGGTDAVPDQHACHGTLAHGHEGPDLGYHHCGLLKPLETAVVPPVVLNLVESIRART